MMVLGPRFKILNQSHSSKLKQQHMKQFFAVIALVLVTAFASAQKKQVFYKSTAEKYASVLDSMQFYVSEDIIVYYDSVGVDKKGQPMDFHFELRFKRNLPGMIDGTRSNEDILYVTLEAETENQELTPATVAFARNGTQAQNVYVVQSMTVFGQVWVKMTGDNYQKYHPSPIGSSAYLMVMVQKTKHYKKSAKGLKKHSQKAKTETETKPEKKTKDPKVIL